MIIRGLLVCVIAAGMLAGFAFGALSLEAVPREACDWEHDFCSEYGTFYAAFSLLGFVAAALGCLGLWRMKR